MLPKTIRNFNAFVDGIGYAGQVSEGTPPTLALQTEEYQGGGMVGPVDISMASVEKMEMTLTFKEHNPAILGLFGHDDVALSLRGAAGPENQAIIIETRGLIRQEEQGDWKAGDEGAALQITVTPHYYKQTIDGETVIEIDKVNMVFITGGVDHLANMKAALGT